MAHGKNIAIIPARGGSKRLERKNVIDLLGKPLIGYTIDACRRWGKFDTIFVNTEDVEISQCASAIGATVYQRPESLAVDTAKIIDVVKEQITTLKLSRDSVLAILPPTCPLRTEKDLEAAYQLFKEKHCQSPVVSVTQYEKPPETALVIDDRKRLVPKFPKIYTSRSQDHPNAYRYNTGLIFTTPGIFMDQADIVGRDAIPYIMSFETSVDIDYPYHLKLVENIMKIKKQEGGADVAF